MTTSVWQDYHYGITAFILVGVLILLYKALVDPDLTLRSQKKEGIGASHYTFRTDGYGDQTGSIGLSSDAVAAMSGKVHLNAAAGRSGMLSYEPPVFWNGGDMAAISAAQASAASGGVLTEYDFGSDRSLQGAGGSTYGGALVNESGPSAADVAAGQSLVSGLVGRPGLPGPAYLEGMQPQQLSPY